MAHSLGSFAAMTATHEVLEAYVQREGREYERRLFEAHLELRAAAETRVDVRGADRNDRGTVRRRSRPLRTVFGDVRVLRPAYQAPEVPGLHPMDVALNLPDEVFPHGVRKLLAEQIERSSYEEAVAHISITTGVPVHKRQMEELAIRGAQDVDAFCAARTKKEEPSDDLLILTFDAKGIVMRREEEGRGAGQAQARHAAHEGGEA